MFDFIIGPILEAINIIARPAKKYLNYHRNFNQHVDGFRQAQADLQDRKGDVHQQLQDEHLFGKKPKQEVESWFRKVEEKINRAQGVEDKVRISKYPFRSCLGELVDETTQELKKVYADGQFPSTLVVNDPSTANLKLPIDDQLAGTTPAEEIYKYLMGDEVWKIGVCGMGGIGKTTIMKHVHNMLLKETKFRKLIWTTVSQDFDLRRLQKNVASQLNENLSDDEDTTIRAAKLSQMLMKQGRFVIVLDDVWTTRFSLEDVGIPESTVDNGCKLVLTTRSEEVVRSMGCKKVQVACLSKDRAWELFLSKVGFGQDMLPDPTLESTMKLIVKECAGLPLPIVTVAGRMKGISDPLRWENALEELRGNIPNIQDMEGIVFGTLKFSYDHLDQRHQHCFLHCALYPEDYEFDKEEIIEHWIEGGFMDEMGTRKSMHRMGHVVLKKLEENCLLERVVDIDRVKMHDVVRDMALHITRKSPRFFVKAGMQLTELPDEQKRIEDLEKVSFVRNKIWKILPDMPSLKFPKLTTLLLSNNSLEEFPDSFFIHMLNLKVLDLSRNPIVNLPNSLSNMENLTALLLSHCKRLKNVPSLSKLKALKKLDLEETRISKIPQGLEALVNLQYLNLGSTFGLEELPNGMFSKLYRLQHLTIHPTPSREEDMRELKRLEVFDGCFTDASDLRMFARRTRKPHNYLIRVSSRALNVWSCESYSRPFYSRVDDTKMVAFKNFNLNTGAAILLPSDMRQLELLSSRATSLTDMFDLEAVTELKECTIGHCEDLEYVFSSCCPSFQTVESLVLRKLHNLRVITRESEPRPGSFSCLKVISIVNCQPIRNLFSAISAVKDLHNVEEINVAHCRLMEEVITSEEDQGTNTNNAVKFALPKLRKLRLENLPKLKSICSTNGIMVCDSLQELDIVECRELKRIPLYLPLDNGQPSPPPLLKEIRAYPQDWWESVELDYPSAKNVLLPLLKFYG